MMVMCLRVLQVVMSWHSFAEHLLPAGADLQPDPSHHTMLEVGPPLLLKPFGSAKRPAS